MKNAVRIRRFAALLAVLISAAALTASASANGVPAPSAKIGSTRGTGRAGCVKAARTVRFTLASNYQYVFVSGAQVMLDGKVIATRKWAAAVSLSNFPRTTETFTVRVNLAHKAAGRHTLKLTGSFTEVAGRRSGGTHAAQLGASTATASKRITKCAAFTG